MTPELRHKAGPPRYDFSRPQAAVSFPAAPPAAPNADPGDGASFCSVAGGAEAPRQTTAQVREDATSIKGQVLGCHAATCLANGLASCV